MQALLTILAKKYQSFRKLEWPNSIHANLTKPLLNAQRYIVFPMNTHTLIDPKGIQLIVPGHKVKFSVQNSKVKFLHYG